MLPRAWARNRHGVLLKDWVCSSSSLSQIWFITRQAWTPSQTCVYTATNDCIKGEHTHLVHRVWILQEILQLCRPAARDSPPVRTHEFTYNLHNRVMESKRPVQRSRCCPLTASTSTVMHQPRPAIVHHNFDYYCQWELTAKLFLTFPPNISFWPESHKMKWV